MPINTRTLVLAAVAENAIGVPLQRGLPIALFASTLRPMNALIFALLLGRTVTRSAPTGSSVVVPTGGGPGPGTPTGSGGGTTTGGASNKPATMPSFLRMSYSDATAWATFFGLNPKFKGDGPIVVFQLPDVGDPVPDDKHVKLDLGHPHSTPS